MPHCFRAALLFPALFAVQCIYAQDYSTMDIGILGPYRPEVIQVIVRHGVYAVKTDGSNRATLRVGERVVYSAVGNRVEMSIAGRSFGSCGGARLQSLNAEGVLGVFVLSPGRFEAVYDDDLHLRASDGELQPVNEVSMEKYVAGVVEAESGKEKPLEFYKVQAIISRTYAVSNRRRFAARGYHLNDQTDCQVYHGKCRWEPTILKAVELTKGKILVDADMNPITAAFHSNSGGETVGSESVWSGPLPYLSPRHDVFSEYGKHYRWERMIAGQKWLDYLKDKYGLATGQVKMDSLATHYEQQRRHVWFLSPDYGIPLKELRKDWGLKSTYFNIVPSGDSLKFSGRGFGHGAGLSQEGAIRMAELGMGYADIIHFYYDDVHIVPLGALDFFRRE